MLTPDYRTFLELSRNATLIPVAKTLSADLLTPVGAFLSIAARQKYAFLLESVEGARRLDAIPFLARNRGRSSPPADKRSRSAKAAPCAATRAMSSRCCASI